MRARALKWVDEITGSYWFVPALMALGALALAALTIFLDSRFQSAWWPELGSLFGNRPEDARTLLSTIAGSMITVAGVTFSITIATVAQATSQFGPRLLTNFMHDLGNQITLGTFIATFLYCLPVLLAANGSSDGGDGKHFVPQISLMVALALAIISLAVLIYFFHHISESLHISHIVANTSRQLQGRIGDRFPAGIGQKPPPELDESGSGIDPAELFHDARPVRAEGCGYIQQIDGVNLMALASQADLQIWLKVNPGYFVNRGTVLMLVRGAWSDKSDTDAQARQCFALGSKRTLSQDVMLLVDQLLEIAIRALSPGISDPFTAKHCISCLGCALVDAAASSAPAPDRRDSDGALRVFAQGYGFTGLVDRIFDHLRPSVQAYPNVAIHALTVLAEVSGVTMGKKEREALVTQAEALHVGCHKSTANPRDMKSIARAYRSAIETIREDRRDA